MNYLEHKWAVAVPLPQKGQGDLWASTAALHLATAAKTFGLRFQVVDAPVSISAIFAGANLGSLGRPEISKVSVVFFDTDEDAQNFYRYMEDEFPQYEWVTQDGRQEQRLTPSGVSPQVLKRIEFIEPAVMEDQPLCGACPRVRPHVQALTFP